MFLILFNDIVNISRDNKETDDGDEDFDVRIPFEGNEEKDENQSEIPNRYTLSLESSENTNPLINQYQNISSNKHCSALSSTHDLKHF